MPRNGSGVCSPSISFVADQAASTPPQSSRFDSVNQDLADEITNSIACDGQSTVTANIPMAGFKFTGLGQGVALTDSVNVNDLRSNGADLCSPSGTTTLTATLEPAPVSYSAGMRVWCIMPTACGGATTINLNGLGAKNIKHPGGADPVANDWNSGDFVLLYYDTVQFILGTRQRHSDIPLGTKLLCVNASAPTGYTQDTNFNDKVFLASSSANGGTAAGSWAISGLSTESATHAHTFSVTSGAGGTSTGSSQGTSSSGGASTPIGDHTHPVSGTTSTENALHTHTGDGSWRPALYYTIVITRD